MVQENGGPTAEQKGKGKAVDKDAKNGEKTLDDAMKNKQGKPEEGKPVDGKKDGEIWLPEGRELSHYRCRA